MSDRRMGRTWWALVVAGAAASLGVTEADAQATPWSVGAGALVEHYSFSDADAAGAESLSLTTIPFGAQVLVGRKVDLQLRGYWASGTLVRPGGGESSISGLTDTWLTAAVPVANDAVTLTGILVLPTGESGQTFEQAEVAGLIASDLFPFAVSNWGSGGGFGAQVGYNRIFGSTGVAATAGYIVGAEFEPTQSNPVSYRPGNELRLSAAADFLVGDNGKLAFQALWQNFANDQLDGTQFYTSGDRLHLLGAYSFPVGRTASGVAYLRFLHRDQGQFDEGFRLDPTRDLIMAGGGIRRAGLGGVIQPSADLRVYRQSDGIGQGVLFGIGGSGEWDAGSLELIPVVKVRFGSLEIRQDATSGVVGLDLGLTIRIGQGSP